MMIDKRKGGELLLKVVEGSLYKDSVSVCHGVGRDQTVKDILTDPSYEPLTINPEKVLIYVFMVLCQILF